ncbi:MAG: bifunctional DNA-formamidopyrimidine glycosylase/DNA-(apurinic or apyrimidinic site) lyase [Alphaproteobacteria bacterium]|nr:bifunctional DNA-formamidopyrimidine glycosylase/DNA-(apurinic or apyrimidinic site) lyase [Alphaproteobacteria bacterium]
MPELPEVETLRAELDVALRHAVIDEVVLRRNDLRFPMPKHLPQVMRGQAVRCVARRAKYLLIEGEREAMLAHLGMSGKMVVHEQMPKTFGKHDHVVFSFRDGRALVFTDPRRFGMLDLLPKQGVHKLLAGIGPEPLESGFDAVYLSKALEKRRGPIKTVIMDQRLVAGVGNIYASEALFLARISPSREAGSLTKKEATALLEAIQAVLRAAIASGGSTLRDYVRSGGEKGWFQHEFKVYDREGEACVHCGEALRHAVMGGRATYYCETCQR